MSSVVHAVLVEKPNKSLETWIVGIVAIHTIGTVGTAYAYSIRHTDEFGWISMLISWVTFGVIVPIFGLGAARRADNKRLAIFTGIQAFVGVCNAVNFLSFTSVFIQVLLWCQSSNCQNVFANGNRSCAIDLANQTYEMGIEYCQHLDLNLMTSFFYGALATVSLCAAMHAQRQKDIRVAEIVTINSVTPNIHDTSVPAPPEDGLEVETIDVE